MYDITKRIQFRKKFKFIFVTVSFFTTKLLFSFGAFDIYLFTLNIYDRVIFIL